MSTSPDAVAESANADPAAIRPTHHARPSIAPTDPPANTNIDTHATSTSTSTSSSAAASTVNTWPRAVQHAHGDATAQPAWTTHAAAREPAAPWTAPAAAREHAASRGHAVPNGRTVSAEAATPDPAGVHGNVPSPTTDAAREALARRAALAHAAGRAVAPAHVLEPAAPRGDFSAGPTSAIAGRPFAAAYATSSAGSPATTPAVNAARSSADERAADANTTESRHPAAAPHDDGGARPASHAATPGASAATTVAAQAGTAAQAAATPAAHAAARAAAGAASTTSAHAPALEAAVEKIVQRLANAPQGSIALPLDPPELGRVMARFSRRGDLVKVQLIAETPEVASSLTKELPKLQASLESGGSKVQVDVQLGGDALARGAHGAPGQGAVFDDGAQGSGERGGTSRGTSHSGHSGGRGLDDDPDPARRARQALASRAQARGGLDLLG